MISIKKIYFIKNLNIFLQKQMLIDLKLLKPFILIF